MDKVTEFIQSYVPLVDFLAEILGKNSEIVLNDLRDVNHSIIAIRNNSISQRKVGDPASDLALRTIKSGNKEQRAYVANYQGMSDTHRLLRSSSFFLRFDGRLVAMLCINTDDACLSELQQQVTKVLNTYKPNIAQENRPLEFAQKSPIIAYEHLSTSSKNYAQTIVNEYLNQRGITKKQMKRSDRLECVRRLYSEGFFQLKDSVVDAAKALGASEPSVYRYVQIVRSHEVTSQDEHKDA